MLIRALGGTVYGCCILEVGAKGLVAPFTQAYVAVVLLPPHAALIIRFDLHLTPLTPTYTPFLGCGRCFNQSDSGLPPADAHYLSADIKRGGSSLRHANLGLFLRHNEEIDRDAELPL